MFVRLILPVVMLLVLFVVIGFLGVVDVATSGLSTAAAEESKRLFMQTDRCDPLSCFEHFQVTGVVRLAKPVLLSNTGAAKLNIPDPSDFFKTRGITIIESEELLPEAAAAMKYQCPPGDYFVSLIRRNWLYFPVENISICYHPTSS